MKPTARLCVVAYGLALPLTWACASDPSGGPTGETAMSGAGMPATAGSTGGSALPMGPSDAAAGSGGASTGAAPGGAGTSVSAGAGGQTGGAAGASGSAGGGSGGGPPSGGAGPGGDSRCSALTGASSCDGFENAAPGAAGSDWTISGDTVTVDSSQAYRGQKSIKYSATSRAYIVNKKIFSGSTKATNNEFWGRYFVRAAAAAVTDYPNGHTVFGTLADAGDSSDPNRFHFVGGSRRRLMAEIRIASDNYTNSGQKEPTDAAPLFPVSDDGWQCWELHVTADDSFAFYIDGTEVADMRITKGVADASGKSFAPLPVFGQVQLGWQSFNGGSVSGWIDEVAFGPTRITCER